jgi:pectinesterase
VSPLPIALCRLCWFVIVKFAGFREQCSQSSWRIMTILIKIILPMAVLVAHMAAAQSNLPASKTRIVLVGDSTVTDSAGWGLGFKQFLDPQKTVLINTARGGRSSQSYLTEGRWTNALSLRGDYYLIQFGHNNQPGKPGRSTDMPTYVSNLVQYVDEARAAGAKPILVTPVSRREWDKGHPERIKSGLEPWAAEVRKVAAAKQVPLVDLHARSIELYESLGAAKCYEFSPVKGTNADGQLTYDGTHFNSNGWVRFARLVVGELRKSVPELASCLLEKPLAEHPFADDSKYDVVVAFDGSGAYTNIQAAIDAAPQAGTNWFRILIKPGVYEGQVLIPKNKGHICLIGEEPASTVLSWPYNVYDRKGVAAYQFDPGTVVAGDDVYAENLTIENTSGDHGQALALRVDGDRAVFNRCRILGWQDTLMVNNGRQYFTNCYIAGRVDFIYGSGTAFFDRCEIHSKNGGYVTAASTPEQRPFGFVFSNCHLTGDPSPWREIPGKPRSGAGEVQAYLGRPWRPFASVAFLNCKMDRHIKSAGWNNWGNPTNETTARYVEYRSAGPGAAPEKRVKWAKELTETEAKGWTVENVLSGPDGWRPHLAR